VKKYVFGAGQSKQYYFCMSCGYSDFMFPQVSLDDALKLLDKSIKFKHPLAFPPIVAILQQEKEATPQNLFDLYAVIYLSAVILIIILAADLLFSQILGGNLFPYYVFFYSFSF